MRYFVQCLPPLAKFKWANSDDGGSSITLTTGGEGQIGETGVGYIIYQCNTSDAECNNKGNACNDNLVADGSFALIKVSGNSKDM